MKTKSITNSSPKSRGRSSTQDILGSTNGQKVHRKWAEHHRRLIQLREQFLKGRSVQSESAKETVSSSTEHIADGATDSFDRDCALALLSSTQNALYEIEQALNRIANGTYGICELSGQPVEADRLKAIPWTRFSATVQTQLESRHGGGRVQLGAVGTCAKASDGQESSDDDGEDVSTVTAKAA